MRMIERLLAEPLRQLDTRLIGLSSVNWATGYKFDFSWIDLRCSTETDTQSTIVGLLLCPVFTSLACRGYRR